MGTLTAVDRGLVITLQTLQSGALSKVMNNGKEIRLFMKVLDAERDEMMVMA